MKKNLVKYESPFSARYASSEMSYLFSSHYKVLLFRSLWVALAKIQHELGLPISKKQLAELKKQASCVEMSKIEAYEKKFRHDVMAHLHAFGDLCPHAKPILHLGATSAYIVDNADLIQMKEALQLLLGKLLLVLQKFSSLAKKYADSPCLSYTHFQIAQPTTIGKRICLWLQDLLFDALSWEQIISNLPFLGVKGATGTQSSFLFLFNDSEKTKQLDALLAQEFGFDKLLPISGQTYTRKLDFNIVSSLASFATSAHKLATDIRLLAHDGELLESFDKTQVGSSAMPYKRNPIYSERICGIARFVIALAQNPAYTAATQWLERSLDDSANRRLTLPEAFLGADALLNLLHHLATSLTPQPKTALKRLNEHLSTLAMENILMAAVKKGGDRQHLHEKLRRLASSKTFLSSIEKDPDFRLSRKELERLSQLSALIGRAPEQVSDFLSEEITPFLARYKKIHIKIPRIEL